MRTHHLLALLLLAGCAETVTCPDGTTHDPDSDGCIALDSGPIDSGGSDSGPGDSGSDAGPCGMVCEGSTCSTSAAKSDADGGGP